MSTLILIDLSSIKENENADSTQTTVNRGHTTYFKIKNPSEEFLKMQGIEVTSTRSLYPGTIEVDGYITSDETTDTLIKEKTKNIEIAVEFHNETYDHLPIPKYSYKHINTPITCNYCNSEIMSEDLEADEVPLDGDYIYNDCICPKCKNLDCVDIEYETIDEALKRK